MWMGLSRYVQLIAAGLVLMAPITVSATEKSALEDAFWSSLQGDVVEYRNYLEQYPNGKYAKEAWRRIEAISKNALQEQKIRAQTDTQRQAGTGPADLNPKPMDVVTAQVFRDCPECPEMVRLRGGQFSMGSPDDELGRRPSEGPVRSVSVPPFAIGRIEVSVENWNACVRDSKCPAPIALGTGSASLGHVTYERAKYFVNWLSAKTGKRYRLPSEAEWEYAARLANSIESARSNIERPKNMLGGVWEWVADCWHDNYQGAPVDGSPWQEAECSTRVVRGGSDRSSDYLRRTSSRGRARPDADFDDYGFRVATDQ